MDLDSALDDIIKKRKQTNFQQNHKKGQKQQPNSGKGKGRQQTNRAGNANKPNTGNERRNGGQGQQQRSGGNLGVSTKANAKVSKPAQRNTTNINSRLRGGIQIKPKQQQQQQQQQQPPLQRKIDPASIVITKKVGRAGQAPQQQQQPPSLFRAGSVSQLSRSSVTHRGMSIRGAAYGTLVGGGFGAGGGGLSIRGESGPVSVLISNLDPGANSEDIRMVCAQFGQVSQCEVLFDRAGRSLGEAEVEFTHRSAALDCIAKLDNEVADGRVLRAALRSRSAGVIPSSSYMNQTVRSVIAPTRSGFTST